MTSGYVVYVTNSSLNQIHFHLRLDDEQVKRIDDYMCNSPEESNAKAVWLAPPQKNDLGHEGCWETLEKRIRGTPDTLYFMLVTGGNIGTDAEGRLINDRIEFFSRDGKPGNLIYYNFDNVHEAIEDPLRQIPQ
jgi:hypothetical protein